MSKIPQELLVITENYNKDVHKKTSMAATFQEKVNGYLKQGWRVVNCNYSQGQAFPTLVAFLVKET